MIHADERYSTIQEEWDAKASKEDPLITYKALHSTLVEMYNQAEDIRLWPLSFRWPMATWTRGRAVLIRNAAHPMLPHLGQGAAQGLEDGVAFGVLLSHIPEAGPAPTSEAGSRRSLESDVEADLHAVITQRLHLFQEIRQNRTAAMQVFSNAGQDEAKKIKRDARPYVMGKVPTDQQEFHEYSFGYDVVEDCLLELKKLMHPRDQGPFRVEDTQLGNTHCKL